MKQRQLCDTFKFEHFASRNWLPHQRCCYLPWFQLRSTRIRWSFFCLVNFEWIWCRHFQCQLDYRPWRRGHLPSVEVDLYLCLLIIHEKFVSIAVWNDFNSKPTGFLACGTQVNLPYLEVGLRHMNSFWIEELCSLQIDAKLWFT